MPYLTEKMKLGDPFLSKRVKMLPCQKEMAVWWHDKGMGIRAIARMFHVDKRLIQFVLFPERQKKNIEDRHDRGGSKIYYKKEYHTEKIRNHRHYKHEVLKPIIKSKNG